MWLFIAIVLLLAGLTFGFLIGSNNNPCEHQFEKIADESSLTPGTSRVLVYMCMKCGKRKITKV